MLNKSILAAWLVALTATIGSLFFSERMGFIPCTLCWYQRILMYPLVFLLGVAFYRNDKKIYVYALPLSIIGICVSSYHYALQKIPSLQEFSACTSGVPCSGQYINWFGFVTIPFLALLAFVMITVFMLGLWKKK
ncbi:disulfide bond formation protein B [Psychrobacillus sp. AK 1817]|uniref:Probable disulfide formation protein n=1 Tax=Psychrobacillus faecigallinarum TaxID=2762235 RepID=A0ABR8R8A6_9BACI|nr:MULTISPECIES: disulfide oxidoreductase [Psychrobacillus]MBD7944027.1 disulfide bond formation protein B [Psychrobacillus faecigallinarum]QEY20908.1 disulfide bond formation protein B [Psychrobacillus sp. AK 1817]QGM31415.1 disulfide bond formation protein B [Bacillus sp. N3536]